VSIPILTSILSLVCQESHTGYAFDQTVEIQGSVDSQEYRPSGKPFIDQQSHSKFKAVLSGNAWKLEITNRDRANWWSELVYDGTNTYVIQPSGGVWYSSNSPDQTSYTVRVEPSARYIPAYPDPMGLYMVWFTYGLSPELLKTNKIGLVDLPLASGHPRDNLNAFGFKWLVQQTDNGRFAVDFETVRDQALDLTDKEEFLRPELDYPDTLGDYNSYRSDLDYRRALATGFVKYRFRCGAWHSTNGVVVPAQSELKVFLNDHITNQPHRILTLKTETVSTRPGVEALLPDVSTTSRVVDYRFKKKNETRIFKYAEYTLKRGDPWKSDNDPQLIRQADKWLASGRKYTTYADNKRNWTAWIFLMSILAGPLAIYLYYSKQNKKQHENEYL